MGMLFVLSFGGLVAGIVVVAIKRKVTLTVLFLFFISALLLVGALYNVKTLRDVEGGHSAARLFSYEFYTC
jgi:hypothetical protein